MVLVPLDGSLANDAVLATAQDVARSAEEILRAAEADEVAIIVMAARRPRWLWRLLRLSVSCRIAGNSSVPVVRTPYGRRV